MSRPKGPGTVINKSFKYNDKKHPVVHAWIMALEKEGKDFSKAVRALIEENCRAKETESIIPEGRESQETILNEIRSLRQLIAGLRAAGPVTSQQEADLIRIDETVQQIEEKVEIKTVDKGFLKNRYGL